MIDVRVTITGKLPSDSIEEAFGMLLREVEPQLEVALGLMGVSSVSLSSEHVSPSFVGRDSTKPNERAA